MILVISNNNINLIKIKKKIGKTIKNNYPTTKNFNKAKHF